MKVVPKLRRQVVFFNRTHGKAREDETCTTKCTNKLHQNDVLISNILIRYIN